MHIDPITLHKQNKLVEKYRKNDEDILRLFDYHPFKGTEQRVKDLKVRHFDRVQLSEVLHTMNKQWEAPEETLANIRRLEKENSMAVIGGQQAGLLSGPMYTINKIISVIQYAKEQERELNVPVIPVFWVAGEDHDFAEVNHVYLPENSKLSKHTLSQHTYTKSSVSHMQISRERAENWLDQLFEQLPETLHTKGLYEWVRRCLDDSETYVDFFARFVYHLFRSEGLVLVDSGNSLLRRIESIHFKEMIQYQPVISEAVYQAAEKLQQMGYSSSIGSELNDAHLFYHLHGDRILLSRSDNGEWVGKQNEVRFTTEELLSIAKEHPEQLSNNVVTRPLMQELLFPTLAFVGGPGEISYWAELKEAFKTLDIKMPPVIPRLSFTFIERNIDKLIKKYNLTAEQVINIDLQNFKDNWLAEKSDPKIEDISTEVKDVIEHAHHRLRELAWGIRDDIGQLSEKNLVYLDENINFLQKRMIKALEEKYEKELWELDLITLFIQPSGSLQERMWTPLPFLNKHGQQFIKDLTAMSCSFDNEHYFVYL
ncbi:bacillithiol biosynthesis cysteine-adding enzyme BshC [Virgibacillus halodenitrificans]|uniref:bacillithiol biosynthesis cysteine-adding enzyme BshC n=1 Tax=Virgibacillus halodenitrificans TaxID=1482 RepID=UPI0024BF85AD|nr:bacillithiol biosynthesis cysteine-adding enzyme BshC [Virgibacillus halodenitrificans]WHX27070.1 bacillithiol biosynthesis cysteine-adding enzyme BshC [Virgibacillus halodenitrificans]